MKTTPKIPEIREEEYTPLVTALLEIIRIQQDKGYADPNKPGKKKMSTEIAAYTMKRFVRTVDDVAGEIIDKKPILKTQTPNQTRMG